ncbi:MAG TPA: PhzF family phenazine biosynthesis protein [Thermodesulfobacteriota bacterium]|nr:PhzF family phenazine biosynthesis protein [Thermodesulfobacteriota bacterium]
MKIFQVDAFTDKPFSGNPAAVCILTQEKSQRWMQDVAREMNLSETAFLLRQRDGFNLRWFTPTVEVDLCGHATLATAHILWEEGYLKPDNEARFHTKSGLLLSKQKNGWIELDFPIEREDKAVYPPELTKSLGITAKYVGKNRFDYLVEVDSEEAIREMKPDFALLGTIPIRGVMVTSIAKSPEYDFVSRFFAPMSGINEDPVTGSSHCCLGPFWQDRLNKDEFIAYQASERGGILRVRVGVDRVYISGQAVTVLRGELV